MMKQYGVVLTNNFDNGRVIDFFRFETEEEAEKVYQEIQASKCWCCEGEN
jgi:hypothetical protein